MRLSLRDRQKIVTDFVERHGVFNPRAFVEEIKATGGQHPAWEWFTWDVDKAAEDHWIWQARTFVHGLTIKYSVEIVERGRVRVVEAEAPLLFSPIITRSKSGGYRYLDPDDDDAMEMFCMEAAAALQSWLDRYNGAALHAGVSTAALRKIVAVLEQKGRSKAA